MTLETGLSLEKPEPGFASETTQRWDGCGVKTRVFLFSVSGHWEEGCQRAAIWSRSWCLGLVPARRGSNGILSGQGSASTRGLEGTSTQLSLYSRNLKER